MKNKNLIFRGLSGITQCQYCSKWSNGSELRCSGCGKLLPS